MHRAALTRQRLAGIFLVGMVLFFSPVLSLFDGKGEWQGIPGPFVYLFGAWLVVIVLAAWTVESRNR